jgi:hypothetical protein
MEELGVEVAIQQKVAEVKVGLKSRHIYFLVEQTGGEFGTGIGEEYTDSDSYSPDEGIYIPIWMPIEELAHHQNVYPADIARLVIKSVREGWMEVSLFEEL